MPAPSTLAAEGSTAAHPGPTRPTQTCRACYQYFRHDATIHIGAMSALFTVSQSQIPRLRPSPSQSPTGATESYYPLLLSATRNTRRLTLLIGYALTPNSLPSHPSDSTDIRGAQQTTRMESQDGIHVAPFIHYCPDKDRNEDSAT